MKNRLMDDVGHVVKSVANMTRPDSFLQMMFANIFPAI